MENKGKPGLEEEMRKSKREEVYTLDSDSSFNSYLLFNTYYTFLFFVVFI